MKTKVKITFSCLDELSNLLLSALSVPPREPAHVLMLEPLSRLYNRIYPRTLEAYATNHVFRLPLRKDEMAALIVAAKCGWLPLDDHQPWLANEIREALHKQLLAANR